MAMMRSHDSIVERTGSDKEDLGFSCVRTMVLLFVVCSKGKWWRIMSSQVHGHMGVLLTIHCL